MEPTASRCYIYLPMTLFLRDCLIIVLALVLSRSAPAQNKELTADENIPIPKVEFDAQGELKIKASPNSSPTDFDFLVGKWNMATASPHWSDGVDDIFGGEPVTLRHLCVSGLAAA